MRYFCMNDVYIASTTDYTPLGYKEISEAEYVERCGKILEEPTTYTTESLEELTTTELKAILSDMGVSATMNKANMIRLILAMEASS